MHPLYFFLTIVAWPVFGALAMGQAICAVCCMAGTLSEPWMKTRYNFTLLVSGAWLLTYYTQL